MDNQLKFELSHVYVCVYKRMVDSQNTKTIFPSILSKLQMNLEILKTFMINVLINLWCGILFYTSSVWVASYKTQNLNICSFVVFICLILMKKVALFFCTHAIYKINRNFFLLSSRNSMSSFHKWVVFFPQDYRRTNAYTSFQVFFFLKKWFNIS